MLENSKASATIKALVFEGFSVMKFLFKSVNMVRWGSKTNHCAKIYI